MPVEIPVQAQALVEDVGGAELLPLIYRLALSYVEVQSKSKPGSQHTRSLMSYVSSAVSNVTRASEA